MPIFQSKGKNCLFIHIPKTGGSSIECTLQPHVSMTLKHNGIPPGFPCPPQHLHYEALAQRFDLSAFDVKFAIVRHPVNRLVSEYKFRTANRNKLISFNVWADRALRLARNDPYCLNNHMRPQVEFVGGDVKVFRYEDGLETIFSDICKLMGLNDLGLNLSWEKPGRNARININESILALITDFYASDFKRFGYDPKLNLGQSIETVVDPGALSLKRAKTKLEWIIIRPDDKGKRRRRPNLRS